MAADGRAFDDLVPSAAIPGRTSAKAMRQGWHTPELLADNENRPGIVSLTCFFTVELTEIELSPQISLTFRNAEHNDAKVPERTRCDMRLRRQVLMASTAIHSDRHPELGA
jgi:hypothetical protein